MHSYGTDLLTNIRNYNKRVSAALTRQLVPARPFSSSSFRKIIVYLSIAQTKSPTTATDALERRAVECSRGDDQTVSVDVWENASAQTCPPASKTLPLWRLWER